MASTNTGNAFNPATFGAGFETAVAVANLWKDFFAQQFKISQAVSQTVAEQTFAFARKGTEFATAQFADGLKFQQEALKVGGGLCETGFGYADTIRKTAFDVVEKAEKTAK